MTFERLETVALATVNPDAFWESLGTSTADILRLAEKAAYVIESNAGAPYPLSAMIAAVFEMGALIALEERRT